MWTLTMMWKRLKLRILLVATAATEPSAPAAVERMEAARIAAAARKVPTALPVL
jgi:hypothetical protein